MAPENGLPVRRYSDPRSHTRFIGKAPVPSGLDQKEYMTSKIKKILASLLALAALALGGAAIASATNGDSGGDNGAQEKAEVNEHGSDAGENENLPEGADDNESDNGQEAPDAGEAVPHAVAAKASSAAVARTGGAVQEVTAETNDPAEAGDEQGAGEKVSPAGTAYEVDLVKGSTEFKVSLDNQFNVLQVQTEQAD